MPKLQLPSLFGRRPAPSPATDSAPSDDAPDTSDISQETAVEALAIKEQLGATTDPWERLDRQGI
jgi:hypothetical protein